MESTSLGQLADRELALARAAHSGRAARTIHGGQQHVLRQTMIALAGGHELAEHDSPREATLQVIVGKVRLSSAIDSWEGVAGGFVAIPDERHSLFAIDDSVVLLTAITEDRHVDRETRGLDDRSAQETGLKAGISVHTAAGDATARRPSRR